MLLLTPSSFVVKGFAHTKRKTEIVQLLYFRLDAIPYLLPPNVFHTSTFRSQNALLNAVFGASGGPVFAFCSETFAIYFKQVQYPICNAAVKEVYVFSFISSLFILVSAKVALVETNLASEGWFCLTTPSRLYL